MKDATQVLQFSPFNSDLTGDVIFGPFTPVKYCAGDVGNNMYGIL